MGIKPPRDSIEGKMFIPNKLKKRDYKKWVLIYYIYYNINFVLSGESNYTYIYLTFSSNIIVY